MSFETTIHTALFGMPKIRSAHSNVSCDGIIMLCKRDTYSDVHLTDGTATAAGHSYPRSTGRRGPDANIAKSGAA